MFGIRTTQAAWLAGLLLALLGCSRASATDDAPLTVFAAASLRDAMTDLDAELEVSPRDDLRYNFAGSNALAMQLLASPRADVFVSASEAWMDEVERAGLVQKGTRRALLENRLVLVKNRRLALDIESPCELIEAPFEHLALGDPDAVPAGVYAREYLARTTCAGESAWARLLPRVLSMPNVRAALVQAEQRKTTLAFVYRTDAAVSTAVETVFEVSGPHAPEIRYPAAAILRREAADSRGSRFLSLLQGSVGAEVFRRHGFIVASPEAP